QTKPEATRLHSPLKRKKILRQLKQSQCQIAFLQETHLSDVEVYFSSHPSGRKKGVSILIHKQVNFSLVTIHKDTEGRFILLIVTFMNVYAPNEDNPDFIRKVFNVITQHSSGILLMGGDFNCVMTQFMDKQPVSTTMPSRMSKTLKYQSTELGLIDAWRSEYPSCRDFTFYSHRHPSYSRIDYFFTPKAELYRISTPRQWRLNASLLNDKEFINLITKELKFYLGTNTSPEISTLLLWDCAKAYLRGRIISFVSAKKKKRDARQQELEQKIIKLEQQHKQSSNPTLLTNLRDARREYNNLVTEKIKGNLRFTNQKYYEHGKRAS
uniref:exodeoxyribonuclease III n=1 Tax=Dicentrarchus labrax TaxID=13489 RepID=A0A8C4NUS9_DICLA